MRKTLISAAFSLLSRTAAALGIEPPPAPPTVFVAEPMPRNRTQGAQRSAGAKLARMAKEGRVGITKNR